MCLRETRHKHAQIPRTCACAATAVFTAGSLARSWAFGLALLLVWVRHLCFLHVQQHQHFGPYEVSAVGQWKPISCGEPTSIQGSAEDNKGLFFPGIAASECRTGYRMSADTVKFTLSLSVVLVLVYGLTDGYIISLGSKRFPCRQSHLDGWVRRPVLKSLQLQYRDDSICSVQVELLYVLLRLWCRFRLQPGPKTSYQCEEAS